MWSNIFQMIFPQRMSLFTAVDENNLEALNLVLEKPNINLNQKNYQGETPLLRSIRKQCSVAFILRLIQMGSDVNISNNHYATPLHLAVLDQMNEIALELIKHEANINAQDSNKATPLYYAIFVNNMEMINMLLYYGADLTIFPIRNQTPLMQAYQFDQPTLLIPLIRYSNEFTYIKNADDTSIVNSINDIGHQDWINCENRLFLCLAIDHGNVELFKLIWSRIDHEKLLTVSLCFFEFFFVFSSAFTNSGWMICMNLILKSYQALGQAPFMGLRHWQLIAKLKDAFKEHSIEKHDRLAVLYTLFTLGMEVSSYDLAHIVFDYGCNHEYESCIYAGNYCGSRSDWEITLNTFIFSLEEDYDAKKIFKLFKSYGYPKYIQRWYKYFSFLPDMKEELNNLELDISEQLSYMPEIPTLLELARNAAQSFIRNNNNISRPYQFHDIVKGLCLPNNIKNLILFKQHIY